MTNWSEQLGSRTALKIPSGRCCIDLRSSHSPQNSSLLYGPNKFTIITKPRCSNGFLGRDSRGKGLASLGPLCDLCISLCQSAVQLLIRNGDTLWVLASGTELTHGAWTTNGLRRTCPVDKGPLGSGPRGLTVVGIIQLLNFLHRKVNCPQISPI